MRWGLGWFLEWTNGFDVYDKPIESISEGYRVDRDVSEVGNWLDRESWEFWSNPRSECSSVVEFV